MYKNANNDDDKFNIASNTAQNVNFKIIYLFNDRLMKLSSKIPNIKNRATVVHNLIKSYGLLEHMKVINIIPASVEDLCQFHCRLYIEFLQKICDSYSSTIDEDKERVVDIFANESEDFGIDIFTLVKLIAGSSITAAKYLCNKNADIAINWFGGWHHAQRDQAEGFCYVNDIVLAIEKLRATFGKILYIDLDIHHGNGVENAYNFTSKVFTLSFHKYETGFYPGTGDLSFVGIGKGKYYTVNVPLKEGINDISYCNLFKRITDEILSSYQPNAVVLQCGADGLTGDKLGGFNLTQSAYGYCLRKVLSWSKPTLILGGGGYHKANTARCWTYLTSIITGRLVSNNIPDNENFKDFGPDFTLEISPSNRKNYNDEEYLNEILTKIIYNIQNFVKAE